MASGGLPVISLCGPVKYLGTYRARRACFRNETANFKGTVPCLPSVSIDLAVCCCRQRLREGRPAQRVRVAR